jgi:prepilin-type N-terminal cleavage/methylation domain-containing protein
MAGRVVTARGSERGFTLLEVLVALFLAGLGMLAMAPLFVYATESTASSADLGSIGAHAVRRMEILRSQGFGSLAAGGSLTADVPGYRDDSSPDVVVRWTIANDATPPTRKTITVRARATRAVVGLAKEVTFTTVRSR